MNPRNETSRNNPCLETLTFARKKTLGHFNYGSSELGIESVASENESRALSTEPGLPSTLIPNRMFANKIRRKWSERNRSDAPE